MRKDEIFVFFFRETQFRHGPTKVNPKKLPTDEDEISPFRRILPQVIASIVKNLLIVSLGLSNAYVTVIIPVLTHTSDANNPNEVIELSETESSWLGSIAYVFKFLGSIASGWITEAIGRKKAMFIVNLPHIIASLLLYYSTTPIQVFIAISLFGLGVGLMEAAVLTYIGEICEPSIRGVLTSMAGIASSLGFIIVYLLGNLIAWRNIAIVCFFLPVGTMIAICFIPESFMWLLSKRRDEEALKSLQWLRGWVKPDAVRAEFDSLRRYREHSNSCATCEKSRVACTHPRLTLKEKLKDLMRKRTLKAFIITLCCFFSAHFAGILQLRPFIINIFKTYQSPIDSNWATVLLGVSSLCATIACGAAVKVIGKRKYFLISLAVACICHFTLGFYGFYNLPANSKSFDGEEILEDDRISSTLPLILFVVLMFCSANIIWVPFMMLSELFPYKTRGIATGLSAATEYIFAFVATKTFYNIENWLSLPSAMNIYGTCALLGFIVTYRILPETENRTLEDIELHFSDNRKGLTDHKIAQNVFKTDEARNKNQNEIIPNVFLNKAYVEEI